MISVIKRLVKIPCKAKDHKIKAKDCLPKAMYPSFKDNQVSERKCTCLPKDVRSLGLSKDPKDAQRPPSHFPDVVV